MEMEQFSLSWNNFNANLRNGFNSLLQEEHLVDVTLAAEGRFIKAHKAVLSVCSPYFNTLFKANPCKHPIVILQDVNYSSLNSLLQFMYKGEVSVSQDEIPMFMRVAETLKVKGLTENNSDDFGNTNGTMENNSHRSSPYSDSRQQKMKNNLTKPIKKVEKVYKPNHPIRNTESPNVRSSPPSVKSPPPIAVSGLSPLYKRPCLDDPDIDPDTMPFINPKQEPLDSDDEMNNDYDDANLDMSSMLDTTLNESPHASNWLPDSKITDASSPAKSYYCGLKSRVLHLEEVLNKIYKEYVKTQARLHTIEVMLETYRPSSGNTSFEYAPGTVSTESMDQKYRFPLDNIDDLRACDMEITLNIDYNNFFISKFSKIGGTDGFENGNEVARWLTESLFTRNLLESFSWAGVPRCSDEKMAFRVFKGILTAFYEIVHLADCRWSHCVNTAFFKEQVLTNPQVLYCNNNRQNSFSLIIEAARAESANAEDGTDDESEANSMLEADSAATTVSNSSDDE